MTLNLRHKTRVPMSSPDIGDAEIEALSSTLRSGQLSIGPKLEAFESAMAAFIGRGHAVGVNSGTSGLHLAVIGAGVEEGDLVVTTPFSFIASANCILYERAIPVFVDVDPLTGNIDPGLTCQAAEDLCAGGSRARPWLPPSLRASGVAKGASLKAILPVHVFGQCCDMDPILEIARQRGISVLEDACEALGATYKGRKAGSLGDAAVFAFYPNKQITTGEGGIIVSDRREWAALFRSLRNQGRDVFDAWLNHSRLGYNYRLDEMSAALGGVQLGRIEELIGKRERVAGWYRERLGGFERIQLPHLATTTTRMSWFVYLVRFDTKDTRACVMDGLAKEGIPSRPYFMPIHTQSFCVERFGYRRGDFPVSEGLGDTSLALPFSSVMTEEQVDIVCGALRRILS